MSLQIDTHVLELLSSKICHDLISPIGAVANGVEFLEEMGAEAGEEVLELIAHSAGQASAKLQAYRLAFGLGGADGAIKAEDLYNIAEKMISKDAKYRQNWDPHAPIDLDEPPAGLFKIMMCVFLLTMDCLPKGGELKVEVRDGQSVHILGKGENCFINDSTVQTLNGAKSPNEIEPKMVLAYLTYIISRHHDYTISFEGIEDETVTFNISF